MAKAAWCTVVPTSGNGNKTIAISATAHTGRAARSTTVTVQNQNGTKPSKTITVNQAAKALSFSSPVETFNLQAAGGMVTIPGKGNVKSLFLNDDDALINVTECKINGVVQSSGTAKKGSYSIVLSADPGAASEYSFEIKMNVDANLSARARSINLCFYGYATDSASGTSASFEVEIMQQGATSTLSTDKTSLSLATAGTAQNIIITSNDDWTVS